MTAEPIRGMIRAAAQMTPDALRSTRQQVERMGGPEPAKQLALDILDLFLSVGDEPRARAAMLEACLRAVDALERQQARR